MTRLGETPLAWCTVCGQPLYGLRVNGEIQVPRCLCKPWSRRMSPKFVARRFREVYSAIELATKTPPLHHS